MRVASRSYGAASVTVSVDSTACSGHGAGVTAPPLRAAHAALGEPWGSGEDGF